MDEGEACAEADCVHGAPGAGGVSCDLVAFQFGENGGEVMLDVVYPAYLFRVEPVLDSENYLVWKTNFWGVTRLDDMGLSMGDRAEEFK